MRRSVVQWGHTASEAEGRTSYQEHYGFLWRKDRIAYSGKAVSYVDQRDLFAREPYSALFKRLATNQTIALATVHIRYGDSEADRRPEIRALGRYWQWLGASYPNADLHVLVGDMNMPPDDPAWQVLDRSARALITKGRTTLSTTAGEYASLYDQIFVPDGWSRKHTFVAGIFVYPRAYGWGWAVRDHVSDHLPVYLILGAGQFTVRDFGAELGTIVGGHAQAPVCIRLNAAPASRLANLPHVGPARAADIVAGRPWASIHDLVAIDGLGDERVADIRASGYLCAPVQGAQ